MSSDLSDQVHYLSDQARVRSFQRAMGEMVRPGDVVLDLGAGTGIMGLLACRAGARRVYSIDQGGMIEVARQVCRANGYEDRVVFIKALSTEAELPEKVDVVVADQIGYFGFEAGILEYFSDARERFLRQGGSLVPSRLDLCLAPVECPAKWEELESWNTSPAGFDFTPIRPLASNSTYPVKFRPEDLLGEPSAAISLDLYEATASPFEMAASVIIARPGALHGVGGWFSAELSPGVTMSNSPVATQPINRSNLFFPVDRPVSVYKGDRVEIRMHVMPRDKVITWKVEVWSTGDGRQKGTPVKMASFAHSTWKGMLISREELRRTRPDFIPTLTRRGEARLLVLSLSDGDRSISQIQQEVLRLHRDLFRSHSEAAAFVAEVVSRHCK